MDGIGPHMIQLESIPLGQMDIGKSHTWSRQNHWMSIWPYLLTSHADRIFMHLLHIPMVVFIRHLLPIDAPAWQCPITLIPPTRVHLLIFWLRSEHHVPHSLIAVPFFLDALKLSFKLPGLCHSKQCACPHIFALHNRIQEIFL